jgi:hypothetical protein
MVLFNIVFSSDPFRFPRSDRRLVATAGREGIDRHARAIASERLSLTVRLKSFCDFYHNTQFALPLAMLEPDVRWAMIRPTRRLPR